MRQTKFLLLAFVFAFALHLHATDKPWLEIRSPHFRVVTDLSAKRGIEVARRCEQMRAAFGLLMNRASTHDPAPLVILALNGQKEVDALVSDSGNGRHAGLFLPGTDESFILVDASADPWHAIYHEYAHELLNANTTSTMQTWFDEGFAEYFSTLESSSRGVTLGQVPIAELQFLRENGKLMRLADLMAVRQDSPIYRQNGTAQAMFYAESWLLVHYLFDHQLISRAEPFFSSIASGKSLSESAQAEFATAPAKLESDLLQYARGERFRYFSLPAIDTPREITVSELTLVTLHALELDVRWHTKAQHSTDDLTAYGEALRTLLQQESANPTVLRQLGTTLLELGKTDDAVNALTKAARAEPDDVSNHYALALALEAINSKQPSAESELAFDRELGACVQLDPSFADVYRAQALRLAERGLLEQAALLMRKAILLAPRSENYELALAEVELKKHNYAPAIALLHELKSSHNPNIAKQAEYFLSGQVEQSANPKE